MNPNPAIRAILAKKPTEWEEAAYNNQRYLLFILSDRDEEYRREITALHIAGLTVVRLERVQNPFQYGRFIIRRGQLASRGEEKRVVKYYHPIAKEDLTVALEYNMDVRRYQQKHSQQLGNGKNPMFYGNPNIINSLNVTGVKTLLIVDVLQGSSEALYSTFKTTDTEYMPTYVVTVM